MKKLYNLNVLKWMRNDNEVFMKMRKKKASRNVLLNVREKKKLYRR